jgi:type IX secretion system PorP/SprF family membrane protein
MKKLLISIFVLGSIGLYAQQDALYSQYMFNMLVINPAYSGSRGVMSTTASYRYQWVDVPGAPRTLSVSTHTPLRKEQIALGMYFYTDELGPLNDWGIVTNYAYRVMFGENKTLSFGLDLGLHKMNIDWSEANPADEDDYMIGRSEDSKIKPDANFGIYFYSDQYFVGASSKHLFENSMTIEDVTGNYTFKTLARHFYLTGGGAIPVNDWLVFKPSTLIKFTANAPINIDVNASFLFSEIFWLGVSYRTQRNALVFLTEIDIGRSFRIGYSYDTYISKFSGQNKGSHEIMLNYEFDIYNIRMLKDLNIRYF